MIGPRRRTESGSQIHFWAILLVTLLVMVLGVLVVTFPEQMGVPQAPQASPAATPLATEATS